MTTTNNDAFHQLQTHTAEMERCHEEELRKLKAGHDELEAHVRCPQEEEHFANMVNECTHGESHPCQTQGLPLVSLAKLKIDASLVEPPKTRQT